MKMKKRIGRAGPKKTQTGSGRTRESGKLGRAKAKATGTPTRMTGGTPTRMTGVTPTRMTGVTSQAVTGQALPGTEVMDGKVMMGQQKWS